MVIPQIAERHRGSYFSMTGWLIGVLVQTPTLQCLPACVALLELFGVFGGVNASGIWAIQVFSPVSFHVAFGPS